MSENSTEAFMMTSERTFDKYKIVEHMSILQCKMVFAKNEEDNFPENFDELTERTFEDSEQQYVWEKNQVKEKMIQAAIENGANAMIGLSYELCMVDERFLVIYGTASPVRIEPKL